MKDTLLSHLAGQPVIVGAGLAGLSAALHLRQPCVVLSPAPLGHEAASSLAQGGIAAAVGTEDSPDLHAQDTLAAGAGLSVLHMVKLITSSAPDAIRTLLEWGVPFAKKGEALDLHLEAAHSKHRILHVGGDGSGSAIMQTLIKRVRSRDTITVLEGARLEGLVTEEERLIGVRTSQGFLPTSCCVIASGGIGALYDCTTSPETLTGNGLAHAARAGARLIDMEFTQFHPTALKGVGQTGRRPLVSEAVRGAGALLVDETGNRFTEELQPRDIVARAISAHIQNGHDVFLDARAIGKTPFSLRFPGITASCMAMGIDPDAQRIPVSPAMHYHMGGLDVDEQGRTSLPGLWACGEAACTGLHGANRLASNSLLEAFVTGKWVAESIDNSVLPNVRFRKIAPRGVSSAPTVHDLASLMSQYAGLLRDERGLQALLEKIVPDIAVSDEALVAGFIATSALTRRESRGSHWRTDFPDQTMPKRTALTITDLPSP
ncbi:MULTISPECIES: L-aspartate oxidase [Gluconobacter]|uniref:L-aspartate oxidase n=1 Tax=Gluconobacter TaxID=441 RepID=UPI00062C98D8|nr:MULTISPECIES: L-aspartate oxidase [Gluconobacter]